MLSCVLIVSPGGAVEFAGSQASRELVEYSVDHAGLDALDKGGADVGIFSYDNALRYITAMDQHIAASAYSRTQNCIDRFEWPAFRQRFVDQRVEIALFAYHARYDVAKERRLCRKILRSLDLVTHPVVLEFSKNFIEAGTSKVHLVKCLHRRQPGGTALVCFARVLVVACGPRAHQWQTKVCFSATIVSAARAAMPPLSPSSTRARECACASFSTVRIPLPTANRSFTARSINARADSLATISKWWVSPRITQPSATTPS